MFARLLATVAALLLACASPQAHAYAQADLVQSALDLKTALPARATAKQPASGEITASTHWRVYKNLASAPECASAHKDYGTNNPIRFVDPDGRANELAIEVGFVEDFARANKPTRKDSKIRDAAQRSVDLTVSTVLAGSDNAVKADLKAWSVSADPDYAIGTHGVADTIAYPADSVEPKEISTVFGPRILTKLDKGKDNKLSDGITARGGDPSLLVIGLHELSHGADGNIGLDLKASEKDVGKRVRTLIKASPHMKNDIK